MSKSDDVRKLFNAGFNEDSRWTEWFFNSVYNDDDAIVSYAGDQPASCLLLSRYALKLGSAEIATDYLSCATTAKQLRGQGRMRRLMSDALMQSAASGASLVTLIPASTRLYFYYDRFDFATVFYTDVQRYTSLHRFPSDPALVETTPTFEAFHALELKREATVLHSHTDFKNILTDNAIDGGYALAAADEESGITKAMLFATVGESAAVVHDILYDSPEAADTVLACLREHIGERMIIVHTPPTDDTFMYESIGMARIVNVMSLFETLAAQHPSFDQVIRVRDRLLPDNNGIFIIRHGSVEHVSSSIRRVTLDVPVDILAKIIFNSHRIGDTFDIPTYRPVMSLMLD